MAPVALVGRSSAGADAVKSSLAPDYDRKYAPRPNQ